MLFIEVVFLWLLFLELNMGWDLICIYLWCIGGKQRLFFIGKLWVKVDIDF